MLYSKIYNYFYTLVGAFSRQMPKSAFVVDSPHPTGKNGAVRKPHLQVMGNWLYGIKFLTSTSI